MNELISQLFQKIERLEADVRECNNGHKSTLELQNGALVRALEQNTQVLIRLEAFLSRKKQSSR